MSHLRPIHTNRKSEKDQRSSERDQRLNSKLQRKFSRSLSLGVIWLLGSIHQQFIRRELFSPFNCEKWVPNPLLNASLHAKVDQTEILNFVLSTVNPLFSKYFTRY